MEEELAKNSRLLVPDKGYRLQNSQFFPQN